MADEEQTTMIETSHTEATPTLMGDETPLAYTLEDVADYPTGFEVDHWRRGYRARWAAVAAVTVIAAIGFAVAIGVAVHGKHEVAAPAPTIPTQTAVPAPVDADTAYLHDLEAHRVWGVPGQLVYGGHAVCGALRSGEKREDVLAALAAGRHTAEADKSLGPAIAEVIFDAAVKHFCPDLGNNA